MYFGRKFSNIDFNFICIYCFLRGILGDIYIIFKFYFGRLFVGVWYIIGYWELRKDFLLGSSYCRVFLKVMRLFCIVISYIIRWK